MSNVLLIKTTLESLAELFKKVAKLEITFTKNTVEMVKRRRKRKNIYHDKIIYAFEYSFDEVKIENNELIANGRGIVVYDIEEQYEVKDISLFYLDEDKEYVKVYNEIINDYYPNGGSFTFEGKLTVSVN